MLPDTAQPPSEWNDEGDLTDAARAALEPLTPMYEDLAGDQNAPTGHESPTQGEDIHQPSQPDPWINSQNSPHAEVF